MFLGIGMGLVGGGVQTSVQSLLFAQNEPGFMFTPQDMTTLYQDRAGTTPVTAAGQSVGLRLDKSKGLALGAELVANGGFDSDTGWTKGAGVTIAGGVATYSGVATNVDLVTQNISVVSGRTYAVTYTVSSLTGGLSARIGGVNGVFYTTAGTRTEYIFAGATGSVAVGILGRGAGVSAATIDNISVRELAGNHEVAINDAARGIYGWMPKTGRRNFLTYTEQFDNAAWTKVNATVAANAAVAPDGEATANLIAQSAVTSEHYVEQTGAPTLAGSYTASYYVKAGTVASFNIMVVHIGQTPTTSTATFAVTSGVITNTAIAGIITSASAADVGNGWYRCGVSYTLAAGVTSHRTRIYAGLSGNYAGNTSDNLLIWGAQLELGSTATAYQRVVSNYDITEAGVPSCYYVLANGVNTAYVTPTITPGTDKVQVFAGVRKNSDAALGMMAELGNGNFNAFKLFAPRTASNNYAFSSGGTVLSEVTASGFSAPITNVLTGLGDISGDRATLRVNGTQVAQSTADQGTGNYLAYPAYIYARGGTTLPFNGYDFGHVARFGPNLDAATIARVEALLARNTPEVTL